MKPCVTERRLKGSVAVNCSMRTEPSSHGARPVPPNCRDRQRRRSRDFHGPGRVIRARFDRDVEIPVAQRRIGKGNRSARSPKVQCGAPAWASGQADRQDVDLLKKRLCTIQTVPVALADLSGPASFRSASVRSVMASSRFTSTSLAFIRRSNVGSLSGARCTLPASSNFPPPTKPRKVCSFSVSSAKTRSIVKSSSVGTLGAAMRASLICNVARPPSTGLPTVPLTCTSSAAVPSAGARQGRLWQETPATNWAA